MGTWRFRILGWRRMVVCGLLLALAGVGLYRWRYVTPAPGQAEAPSSDPGRDGHLRTLALGTWEDDYRGKRIMTLRDDGTGVMVVEPSGIGAAFASKLTFQMEWSVRNGRMQKRTTGGEPAGRVKLILNMMGDRVDEPILELTQDRLVLLDKDGKTKYNWRRRN